jgi:hypothetical protein
MRKIMRKKVMRISKSIRKGGGGVHEEKKLTN